MTSRSVFWAVSLIYVAALAVSWTTLPDPAPIHFGIGGAADRWVSRTEAVATMAVIGIVMIVVLAGAAVAMRRVPAEMINLPVRAKAWWLSAPEREARLRTMMRDDCYVMGALTMALLVGTQGSMIRAATATDTRLGGEFWVLLGLYLVAVVGYCAWMMRVRYRPPAKGTA